MSDDSPFVDYYEVLQLSQNADADMVERVYRMLAKRFHPDNTESGDEKRFREVHDAFVVLSDPESRAGYDARYDRSKNLRWQIFGQSSALSEQQRDRRIFRGMLSLLYAARRRDPEGGGMGALRLEQMLGVPREHLEFPIWYLYKRGLIERLPSGELAITVEGIDQMMDGDMGTPDDRLLNPAAVEETDNDEPSAGPAV